MARTIEDIQQTWARKQMEILERRFNLMAEAKNSAIEEVGAMGATAIAAAGSEGIHKILTGAADRRAQTLRIEARDEYEVEYALFTEALKQRQAEVELQLFAAARAADPALLFELTKSGSEAIKNTMELALQVGNETLGDICFAEACRRGDDELVGYYANLRGVSDDAWAGLWGEYCLSQAVVFAEDVEDVFDRLFGPAPDRSEFARTLNSSDLKAPL